MWWRSWTSDPLFRHLWFDIDECTFSFGALLDHFR
jgi:hypothetical protein